MSLNYDTSLKNYNNFYLSIRLELKKLNNFEIVSEVNILDKFLEKKLISEKFHKINLQRCIKIDKVNLNKELFSAMFISSILISIIYYCILIHDKYPLLKICIFFYISVVYYLSYKYYNLIIENV